MCKKWRIHWSWNDPILFFFPFFLLTLYDLFLKIFSLRVSKKLKWWKKEAIKIKFESRWSCFELMPTLKNRVFSPKKKDIKNRVPTSVVTAKVLLVELSTSIWNMRISNPNHIWQISSAPFLDYQKWVMFKNSIFVFMDWGVFK